MDFKLNGKQLSLTKADVEKAVQGVPPEQVFSHAVEVKGKVFPVKQAFGLATGVDRLEFTSAQARNVLRRLGFKLFRQESR